MTRKAVIRNLPKSAIRRKILANTKLRKISYFNISTALTAFLRRRQHLNIAPYTAMELYNACLPSNIPIMMIPHSAEVQIINFNRLFSKMTSEICIRVRGSSAAVIITLEEPRPCPLRGGDEFILPSSDPMDTQMYRWVQRSLTIRDQHENLINEIIGDMKNCSTLTFGDLWFATPTLARIAELPAASRPAAGNKPRILQLIRPQLIEQLETYVAEAEMLPEKLPTVRLES